jgi:hypothetical protein
VRVPERSAFFDTADRLLQCVKAELDVTLERPVDRTCVVVGGDLIWDDCECGLLAVQLIRAYQSSQFPIPKQDSFNKCEVEWTVAEYHVSILRCVASSQNDGDPPTCEAMHEDAMVDFDDRWAVLKGVECCLASSWPDNPAMRQFTIGDQLALGEGGRCAGSRLQVFVGLPNCMPCTPSTG